MRPHRRFEKTSDVNLTVNARTLSPRELMNLVRDDIDIEIKARKATYNNGSFDFPCPRSMDITMFAKRSIKMEAPVTVERETVESSPISE